MTRGEWDIQDEYRRLGRELDRMLAEFAGEGRRMGPPGVRALADVWLADDPPRVVVQVDIAGIDPDAVRVELEGDLLAVRGERQRPAGERRVYQHAEIEWGPFERLLRVGAPVDVARARATYDRGMLVITLPLATREPGEAIRLDVRRGA